MANKRISVDQAVKMIHSGMTIMFGGFLANGSANRILAELAKTDVTDLTLICNDSAFDQVGVGPLFEKKQIKKVIATWVGGNSWHQEQMNNKTTETELVPQGTLAERIRCGGFGLGGVLTPVGLGTIVAEGKQVINVDGKDYLLEKPLRADLALIGASLGDESGNLVYKGTSQNFNPLMAAAADVVIAEVDEVVPVGAIAPENVRTPNILVDYLVY